METKQHCQDVHIYLIGSNRFQHELFIALLKEAHCCQCTFRIADSLSDTPEHLLNEIENINLIYLDCHDLSNDKITHLLTQAHQKFVPPNLLALFNLRKDAGVEKKALNFGVRGFFYPHDTAVDFCRGTKAIIRGEIRLARELMSDLILSETQTPYNEPIPDNLSAREKQVLSTLATGASNKDIGNTLCISIHTVRTHLYWIYKKINVTNRSQAILWTKKNLPTT